MERHTITAEELDNWLRRPQWQIFASASNKRLQVDMGSHGPVFMVTDRGETIFIGADQEAAIATYNDVP